MKKHNIFLKVVMLSTISIPIFCMERPPRLSSPDKAGQGHRPSFVTGHGRRLRARYLQAMVAAIDGNQQEPDVDLDQFADSGFLERAPEVLVEDLQVGFEAQRDEYLAENYGISRQEVEAQLPAAAAILQANKENMAHYSAPSTPIRQVAQKIAKKQQRSPLHVRKVKPGTDTYENNKGAVAFCTPEGILGYFEDELEKFAPTPKSKEVVLKHEDTHHKKKDTLNSLAIELAFKAAGLPPSPGAQDRVTRLQEVIADAVPSSTSPESAAATLRVAQRMEREFGKGIATDHHSNEHRVGLATLMCELQAEHQNELARKRKYDEEQADERVKARRNLAQRLEDESADSK